MKTICFLCENYLMVFFNCQKLHCRIGKKTRPQNSEKVLCVVRAKPLNQLQIPKFFGSSQSGHHWLLGGGHLNLCSWELVGDVDGILIDKDSLSVEHLLDPEYVIPIE